MQVQFPVRVVAVRITPYVCVTCFNEEGEHRHRRETSRRYKYFLRDILRHQHADEIWPKSLPPRRPLPYMDVYKLLLWLRDPNMSNNNSLFRTIKHPK